VLPKLRQLSKHTYEAALDLGASPFQAYRRVILPEIMPGVVAGAIIAFTMSIDDFLISYFTTGKSVQTLPMVIYSMTRKRVSPEINALSTLMFVTVLILLIVINILQARDAKKKERRL
jgi:spermidine/putrescine transport system permease protein